MTTTMVELKGEKLDVRLVGGTVNAIAIEQSPRSSINITFETPEQLTAFVSRLVALVMPGDTLEPATEKCPACAGIGRLPFATDSEPCGECGGSGVEKATDYQIDSERMVGR